MHTRTSRSARRRISIETGRLAKQADGAVVVRSGDTMVLVTACAAANPREGIDFLPLTVDYREYTYASGRIPGGFFKREGKPSEKEVLTSRLIDRPIRPLFPYGWRHETQIIVAAALRRRRERLGRAGDHRRVGRPGALRHSLHEDDRRRARRARRRRVHRSTRPSSSAAQSRLDLIVAGTKDAIVMVEAGAKEVSEEEIVQAFERAHAAIREIVAGIDALARDAGKKKIEVAAQGDRPRLLPRGRGEGLPAARRGDADQGQARELRQRRSGPRRSRGQHPRRRGRAAQRRQGDLQGAEGKGHARRGARARQAARRPRVRRDPPDQHRSRRAAAHPRLVGVPARRDPGAGDRDARHRRGSAEGRNGRRRDVEALHAALQLPAVLGR